MLRCLFFLTFFGFAGLASAQLDSLLRSSTWLEESSGELLRFTADGTFEIDYGERGQRYGRYLMGRYTTNDSLGTVTLGVDYLLGKRRLSGRYRRGRDFYLEFSVAYTPGTLTLTDLVKGGQRVFIAVGDQREDPAARRLPTSTGKLKLPDGWGGQPLQRGVPPNPRVPGTVL